MNKISFFTSVYYEDHPASIQEFFLEKVDSYFYLGGKRAKVIVSRELNQKTREVVLTDSSASLLSTVLKIISYMTIILPLVMLVVKATLRSNFNFILKEKFSIIDSEPINEPLTNDIKGKREKECIAATKIQSVFRGNKARLAFRKLKRENQAAKQKERGVQESKVVAKLHEGEAIKKAEADRNAEAARKAEEDQRGQAEVPSVVPQLELDVKAAFKSVPPVIHSEFLIWLKEDIERIEVIENWVRLILIIGKAEVEEKEIRAFYVGLDESIVLQILNSTQTFNLFNALNETIIKRDLILETHFIKAMNKKRLHRNHDLRAKIEQRT